MEIRAVLWSWDRPPFVIAEITGPIGPGRSFKIGRTTQKQIFSKDGKLFVGHLYEIHITENLLTLDYKFKGLQSED